MGEFAKLTCQSVESSDLHRSLGLTQRMKNDTMRIRLDFGFVTKTICPLRLVGPGHRVLSPVTGVRIP